jgi:hypothetical protein
MGCPSMRSTKPPRGRRPPDALPGSAIPEPSLHEAGVGALPGATAPTAHPAVVPDDFPDDLPVDLLDLRVEDLLPLEEPVDIPAKRSRHETA